MNIKLKSGVAYTLVSIGPIGSTFRDEIVIAAFEEKENRYVCKKKGKRKALLLPEARFSQMLVFEGHDLPFVLDSETNNFWGNAKFNFVTDDSEQLKAFILEKCLNPSPDLLHKVLYRFPDPITTDVSDMYELFFDLV